MAGNPKIYGQFIVAIYGEILSEAAEVTWGNENSDTDVTTIMSDSWAGTTPSPGKTMGSVTLHDPVVGSILEQLQDYEQKREMLPIDFIQLGGGKTMKTTGVIRNVKGSGAVGANASISFEVHGTVSKFE